jgi:preprotein translocase subunit SecY
MGDEGAKKITKLTRIASIAAAVVFAALYCVGMRNAVTTKINYWVAIVICGVSIAVGNAFCGWCVELLNTKGIGDGLTNIIVAGILRDIPHEIARCFDDAHYLGIIPGLTYAIFGALLFAGLIFFVVFINMGEKKIRIIFSKRTVGMKQYGMQNQVIPLKVAQAGITPIIYTLAVTLIPSVIIAMVVPGTEVAWAESWKNLPTHVAYIPFFIVFLVFFTYIFAMLQFNPFDMSSQIKQNGGYIQGIKPGKPTSQYLMNLYNNLNSADCFYLILFCVLPMALSFIPGFDRIAFGGIAVVLVGGGLLEMKTLLDNALKTEEEQLKAAGKDKKRKNYNKK